MPEPASFSVTSYGFSSNPHSQNITQEVQITNNGSTPVSAPLFLVLDNLAGATLANADGTTALLAPFGSPYVSISPDGDGFLRPHESRMVKLQFLDPSNAAITYNARVLNVTPAP
jgi:hypothetical protein